MAGQITALVVVNNLTDKAGLTKNQSSKGGRFRSIKIVNLDNYETSQLGGFL
ncbi:MAG: hypothetical protein Q7R77_03675 [Candidatus Daviesbacteria bacterium]|nr:hypothetical protein [Candidatus Daviesbacteria bacterium]